MVGEPRSREHYAGHAAEVGGFPGLQTTSQTTQSSGEMSAGDQLQHTADQTPPQQPACVHAFRGEDGLGENLTHLQPKYLPRIQSI